MFNIKVHAIGILEACESSISRALAFKRRPRSLETLVKVFAGAPHARVLAQTGIPADICTWKCSKNTRRSHTNKSQSGGAFRSQVEVKGSPYVPFIVIAGTH